MTVVVSPGFVLGPEQVTDLSLPRILYDDVFPDGTISATTSDTNAQAANVADGLTWDFWRPTALPARLEVTLDEVREVDYCLVAAHDLSTSGASVRAQYHDGTTWQDAFDEQLLGSDDVTVFLFDKVQSTRFAVYVDSTDASSVSPSIGVVKMGEALVVPRGLPLNSRPARFSRKTDVRPQLSEGGLLLGRSIRREGVKFDIKFQYLDATWVRNYLDPFMEYARTGSFGWLWHPRDYPAEVALCWTASGSEDIRPEYANLQDRMNVTISVEGITR